jgi:hypothetical protein
MKKINNLFLNLLKLWLKFKLKLKDIYFSHKKILRIVIYLFLLSIISIITAIQKKQIEPYLISLGFDRYGNIKGFFSTLFIAIGCSILGVIAITFALSIFSVQQASERFTPSIIGKFSKDKIGRNIFWAIASISFIFFIFALIPLESLVFYEVFLSLALLFIIFILLRKQYAHIVNIVNPSYQLIFHHNTAIKLLNKIDKWLDLNIKLGAIKPGLTDMKSSDEQQRKNDKNKQRDQLRSGLILRSPYLFYPAEKSLEQIYSLISTYLPRKDYEVLNRGFLYIYSVVFKYLEIKSGTFFPSSIIKAYDFSSDSFLNNVFEKLASFQRVATNEKNMELTKLIIICYTNIAIKCTEIRYLVRNNNEYIHAMLAVYYMQQSIEDSVNAGLLDIGIDGSIAQKDIGLILIRKNAQTNILSILDNLKKIAFYGITKEKATFLISYPIQAYSYFLREWVFNKDVELELLPNFIFEKVGVIIQLYLKFRSFESSPQSVELQYALGDFVDLSKPLAFPYIFDEVFSRIEDEKFPKKEKDSLKNKILDLAKDLWRFYDNLSKYAAEEESFLIHFIDSNLLHISMTLLQTRESNEFDQGQKKEILKYIAWIISIYWRIYHYHKKISRNYDIQIFENLLRIGYEFNNLSLNDLLYDVISNIISIGESFFEKKKDSHPSELINIILKAIYLCILNGSKEVFTKFLNRFKDRFWKDYCAKFRDYKNLLFEQLEEIEPEHLRLNPPHLMFEEQLLSKFEKENILKYSQKLKDELKT